MSKLNELMAAFCHKQGIDALSPNEDGEYQVVFDNEHRVTCFERFEQLHLLSSLEASRPAQEPEEVWLKRILNHALGKIKDNPCTPTLLEDGSVALLARLPIARMDLASLEDFIEAHVNALEGFLLSLANPAGARSAGIPQMILRP
ncbi:MAG: CesT family type III secretion system chaperone [Gammaproteobacteria bacterium]|nr:CesT family type III secretion system chaperone [Gammaproteobacteria bacterium]MDE0273939.1 CesT family type III secretion system chaperone [Gammaproteobacteria bacterium]